MGTRIFVAGLAAEPLVLAAVLGAHGSAPAQVTGLVLTQSLRGPWPVPQRGDGVADGRILTLDDDQEKRLDFVLRSLGLEAVAWPDLTAIAYLGSGRAAMTAAPPQVLAVLTQTVRDILRLQPDTPA